MSIENIDSNKNEELLPEGFLYHPEGYLWYVFPVDEFSSLPGSVTVEGEEYTLKSEFHVTVINARGAAQEIAGSNSRSVSDIERELQELLSEYVSGHQISFSGFQNDLRLAVTSERKSIAARCNVDGIQGFFDKVNKKFNMQIPVQPAHVSLYTVTGAAVGIDSEEQMESYKQVTLSEVQEVLGSIKL